MQRSENPPAIHLRPAGPADAARVLRFIRELAEYERELTEERVMRAEAEAKAEARRRVAAEDAQAASETEEKGGE